MCGHLDGHRGHDVVVGHDHVLSRRQQPADPAREPGVGRSVRHHVDGHPRRGDQARLADHPGEQVLRRDLHRAQPEQLPLADPPPAGRAAHELLRHRPLQHGQLHLAGVRPGALLRRAGRLLDVGEHDEQQQRDHHHRHRGHGDRHRRHAATGGHQHQPAEPDRGEQRQLRPAPRPRRGRRRAGQQRLRLPHRRARRCSTSTTPRASRGRPTPRTSAAPSPWIRDLRDRRHPRRQRHRPRSR